jgi:general secretion pathway protein L
MAALSAPQVTRVLRHFLSWWWAELRAMAPAALRRPSSVPDAVLLDDAGRAPSVSIRRRARETTLGANATAELAHNPDLPVHLRVAEDIVLRRQLCLPLDAEATLRQAIAFQIDGLTPFKREEVYFGHRVDDRNHGAGVLLVSLAAVPKSRVAAALARADAQGLPAAMLEAPAEGTPILIPLSEPDGGAAGRRGPGRMFTALLGMALLLVGVAAFIPIDRVERRVADLSGAVEKARDNAQAVQRLREKLASIGETGRFFAERKAPGMLAIDVLGELTQRLPDSAWLTELQVNEKQILVSGFATNAPSLLGALEASPMFANTNFRSPVTREGNENIERFELSSDLARGVAK